MKVVMWDLLHANEWNNMKAGQDSVFRKMRVTLNYFTISVFNELYYNKQTSKENNNI
jgi:hypothetical protein